MSEIIIKTPEQIDGIRKSSRLASQALDFIEPFVQPGITTNELDAKLETFIRDHGAIPAPKGYRVGDLVYPKATCISLNEVICHGIPSDRRLVDGDILNIDVTTILDGYYGDTSRMYCAGNVAAKAKQLITDTKTCLDLGIEQVQPGSYTGNIGAHIAVFALKRGYSVVTDFTGHGVGILFHEPPNIPHLARPGTGDIMKPNMVFTIEPMINLGVPQAILNEQNGWEATTADGALSAQWEHTILVTPEGHEILTVSKEP